MLPQLLSYSTPQMKAFLKSLPSWKGISPGLRPVGDREGNYGTIAVTKEAGDAVQEIPTNQMDIMLESEFRKYAGPPPEGTGPHQWANLLFKMPGGFCALPEAAQKRLAENIRIDIDSGEGSDKRVLTFRDYGIGMTPESMPNTILSLNRRIKLSKPYTSGSFGQGGSSTYAFSQATLIASRCVDKPDEIGFTLVWETPLVQSLKPATYFAYLVYNNQIPTISVEEAKKQGLDFPFGTLIRYYGFDFSSHPHAENLAQLFQKKQFDPPLPLLLKTWKDEEPRIVRGARNELQLNREYLYYNKALLRVSTEDGFADIEYWVLPTPTKEMKRPNARYVDPYNPIVATFNGQAHGYGEGAILDDCNLALLKFRLVIHINCTNIRATNFFATTRTEIRWNTNAGLKLLAALKNHLSSDKRLQEFQKEAEDALRPKHSPENLQERQRHLLSELRFVNIFSDTVAHKEAAPPLEPKDPPEVLRILGATPIVMTPGRARKVTFQTDAPESYRGGMSIRIDKKTGRMLTIGTLIFDQDRIRIQASVADDAAVGHQGQMLLSITPTLKITVPFVIKAFDPKDDEEEKAEEEKKAESEKKADVTVPVFVPVKRRSQQWMALGWPSSPKEVACSFLKDEKGIRELHYSMDYPDFKGFYRKIFQVYGEAGATYFQTSYEEHLLIGLYQVLKIFQGKTIDPEIAQLTYNSAAATASTGAYRQWREWQAAQEEASMGAEKKPASSVSRSRRSQKPRKTPTPTKTATPVKKRA